MQGRGHRGCLPLWRLRQLAGRPTPPEAPGRGRAALVLVLGSVPCKCLLVGLGEGWGVGGMMSWGDVMIGDRLTFIIRAVVITMWGRPLLPSKLCLGASRPRGMPESSTGGRRARVWIVPTHAHGPPTDDRGQEATMPDKEPTHHFERTTRRRGGAASRWHPFACLLAAASARPWSVCGLCGGKRVSSDRGDRGGGVPAAKGGRVR